VSGIVVCDTGPLLHLHEAGALEFLRQAGDILIPPAVEREFVRNAAGSSLPERIKVFDLGKSIAVQTKKWINNDNNSGEAQAIGLAIQEEASWFMTDDGRARRFAESLGLEVHGAVGLLLWAAANDHIASRADGHALLDSLARSSLWISKKVLNDAQRAIDVLIVE
jgi:hypothetical protein